MANVCQILINFCSVTWLCGIFLCVLILKVFHKYAPLFILLTNATAFHPLIFHCFLYCYFCFYHLLFHSFSIVSFSLSFTFFLFSASFLLPFSFLFFQLIFPFIYFTNSLMITVYIHGWKIKLQHLEYMFHFTSD